MSSPKTTKERLSERPKTYCYVARSVYDKGLFINLEDELTIDINEARAFNYDEAKEYCDNNCPGRYELIKYNPNAEEEIEPSEPTEITHDTLSNDVHRVNEGNDEALEHYKNNS